MRHIPFGHVCIHCGSQQVKRIRRNDDKHVLECARCGCGTVYSETENRYELSVESLPMTREEN